MSNMHIDSVLSQIRSISTQVHARASSPVANVAAGQPLGKTNEVGSSFSALMHQGIDQVNQTQLHASDLAAAFERGTPGVELPEVMLEMQKANVSFRALTEVRNRFVSAYQEVMNMQI
jgi:flagellar hook-basal body complex protein FliE